MKPESSIGDPMSMADSESIASMMTPTGEYGRARGFNFKEQPQSTTHRTGPKHFDMSTPKGNSAINFDDFKVGVNIP